MEKETYTLARSIEALMKCITAIGQDEFNHFTADMVDDEDPLNLGAMVSACKSMGLEGQEVSVWYDFIILMKSPVFAPILDYIENDES